MTDPAVRPIRARIPASSAPGGLVFVTRSRDGVELSRTVAAFEPGILGASLVAGAELDAQVLEDAGGGRLEVYDGDTGDLVAMVLVE